MRVAVIGAGLSGLAAAARLRELGHHVTVFEKSRGVGGRLATRRTPDGPVDHGCPALDIGPDASASVPPGAVAPDGSRMPPPPTPCRVQAFPMDTPVCWDAGVTTSAKYLASGIATVLGTRIAALRPSGTGYELGDEQGNPHGYADAVVVSAPAPQAADLLAAGPPDPDRVAALRAIAYLPALVVLLAYPDSPAMAPWIRHPADGPALRIVDMGPRASGTRSPLVVTLDTRLSAQLIDTGTDAEIADRAVDAVRAAGILGDPSWTQVKRWRFAVPDPATVRPDLNPAGSRIVLCGDALAGPGLGAVYASGISAAERVHALI